MTLPGRRPSLASAEGRRAPAATEADAICSVLAGALSTLEQSGARWALLRGESELGGRDGDVDILVAPADVPRLDGELAQLGFGRLRRHGRGPHTYFLAYDAAGDSWVKLDVVTDLAYGRYHELPLGGGAGCLERRRRAGDLVVLSPDDGFWTLLLHCLLDGSGFPEVHRRALLSLSDRAGATDPLAAPIRALFPEAWGVDECLRLVKAEDWAALERAAPLIRAAWLRRCRLTGRARALRNRMVRRLGRVPPLCAPGLTVHVGPAESGLASAVAERWPLPCRRLRLHGSLAARLGTLALTHWHAAWGRLVVLELTEDGRPSRLLERVVGKTDDGASAFTGRASVQEATTEVWRRYVGSRR